MKKRKPKTRKSVAPKHSAVRPVGAPPKYTTEIIESLAAELSTWFERNTEAYWLKSFAIEHGFPSEKLSEFSAKNEKFREALKHAKDMQELRLVELGLELSRGKNKPAFVIFALKNVAGWRDRMDVTSQDEKITEVRVTIVNKA